MIYLDNNATTPVSEEVFLSMEPFLREFYANPSATYGPARKVREAIEEARFLVAQLLGAQTNEISFTSCATESINTALMGMSSLTPGKGIVHLSTDHVATLSTVSSLGNPLLCCSVDTQGRANVEHWQELLKQNPSGVTYSLANSETGILQEAELLSGTARDNKIPVHIDAVQCAGKIPLNMSTLEADYLSISAHKFHGPKGVGALYVRSGVRYMPLIHGGDQEDSHRAGTENVPGIIGMGRAAQLAYENLSRNSAQMLRLRTMFEETLLAKLGTGITVLSYEANRLPNTSNICFHGCTAQSLSMVLESQDILCSSGSACKTASPHPSHVLTAMGLSDKQARACLRFSLSSMTTEEEITQAINTIIYAVEKNLNVQSSQTGPVIIYRP